MTTHRDRAHELIRAMGHDPFASPGWIEMFERAFAEVERETLVRAAALCLGYGRPLEDDDIRAPMEPKP